ncbi:hypothetical protein AURDEDRAFT_76841, partial [Auricularia subglabra TFB-10046 SS5]
METYVRSASPGSTSASLRDTSVLGDIWHSGFLHGFQWAHGSARNIPRGFVSTSDGELRLLFSLAIDWFTAHGGKQAGKKWSIGAIYLVCQNLPLEIRFRAENVCLVGIIPGRTKPLGSAVNWFLRRVVDEFVTFYERGVWYTQTFKFESGRLVRAAIGPVVCDLDAARGIAGLGSVSHTLFCSLCSATKHQMADFDGTFTPRCGSIRVGFPLWTFVMNLWTSAVSMDDQATLWKTYAIRWTELARLRYWNPFQFLVIDTMHCLFLGLFRRHFRFIWRMDVDTCGWGDEERLDSEAGERISAAAAAAEDLDFEPSVKPATGKKKSPSVALGRGVLTAVSKDIQRTVLPDWVDPAPTQVGNTKHGKLSANHWRSLCTIHCVITLIRLWGFLKIESFRYSALENFLLLVKAVQLATLRTTTASRCEAYSSLLNQYLNGLKRLYPTASITPNHHLATHIPEFLRRFGPPHSWWAFPFERYNGMLQKIKTN